MIRTALVPALIAAAVPASLQAQDRWETEGRGQMAGVAARAAARGSWMTPQDYYARPLRGSEVLNLNLSAAREYAIVAARAVIAVTWPAPAGRGACSVLAVADGMGGADGGEVASRLAIEAVEENVAARWTAGTAEGR